MRAAVAAPLPGFFPQVLFAGKIAICGYCESGDIPANLHYRNGTDHAEVQRRDTKGDRAASPESFSQPRLCKKLHERNRRTSQLTDGY